MAPDEAVRLSFEEAPIGIVLAENRHIQTCNARFAALSGYPREDLIGQSFRIFYASDEEFERVRDIGLEVIRETGQYTDQRLLQRKDGTHIWCRFRARSLVADEPLKRVVMSFAQVFDLPGNVTLTPRQKDVLAGLRRGLTSKEIARELGLSPRTVEDVRARLLKLLSAHNTAELLAKVSLFN
ncbi:LuxR family transcriptional regulator [Roseibium sp. TrichSKD4]|uniref:PAS and helix-turn-helix domain-containing protein n=1 Tax=Roseibium sp. TrichSKD4 TaxID=744980 RepID=UPI0001E56469|nr:PAS and helix-turn-helix domain-containing protein [Roseibium sp. TrichSKD4]EFO34152.1 LuxR family transcriptional regulator [Roseibium sp. TrichSKD4]